MIRPTSRAVLALAAGLLPSWLCLLFFPQVWALVLYGNALLLLAVGMDGLFLMPRHLVTAAIEGDTQVLVGESAELTLTVHAPAHRRSTAVSVHLDTTGHVTITPSSATLLIAAVGVVTMTIRLRPHRRGSITVDRARLTWRGRLGLMEQSHTVDLRRELRAVPNVRSVRATAIEYFARESVFGLRVMRFKGEGTEFESMRPYIAGLDSRLIDWKHSARHRTLICKEHQAERNHHIVLAFDTGYLMQEEIQGIPRLDHAIHSALLLSWVALKGGDHVGSYSFDARVRHYAPPTRGAHAYQRIQQAAAVMPYVSLETNFTLGLTELQSRLKRRCLVVVLTEFVDTVTAELMLENMQRLSRRHVVIFAALKDPLLTEEIRAEPDSPAQLARSVVAYELLGRRSVVMERLERMGVHCIDADAARLPVALLNRYLDVKRRGLV